MKRKNFKLYADECIEQNFIDHLREEHNLNVRSVRDDGLEGRSDVVILKRANKTRRFLLTYNTKDFFENDKLFPFKGLFGIISLKSNKIGWPCYHILWLPVHAKQSLVRKKFSASLENVIVRYKSEEGKVLRQKLLLPDIEECLLCKFDEEHAASAR